MSDLPTERACGTQSCGCPPWQTGIGSRCLRYRAELQRETVRRGDSSGVDLFHQLEKIGVPRDALKYARTGLSTVALKQAQEFMKTPREYARALVLAGPRGCGKSVAAAGAMLAWAREYSWNALPTGSNTAPAHWVAASQIVRETDFGRVDPEWLKSLVRAQIVALDDVGEESTPVGLAALADLLKARHEAHRRTVVTTNLPLDRLEKLYGSSWFERLKVNAVVPDLRHEKSLRKRPTPTHPGAKT